MRRWQKYTYGSPLYATLAEVVAESPELLRVINRIPHEPPPNVMFAAVHYLLMKDPSHPLAQFYRSIVAVPRPPPEVGDPFYDFVLTHEESIVQIGNSRYTQTNECRRCVALLPAVWMSGFDRFHLVDVGTSAGLNLGLDRYAYDWGSVRWGESSVLLESTSKGTPPAPRPISVLSRTGLDINPVDVDDADERAWLAALVWPEHVGRRKRLEAAIELAGTYPKRMVAGRALDTLPDVLAQLPVNDAVVVTHSFVLNQFYVDDRARFHDILEEAETSRPVHRVGMEILHSRDKWASLTVGLGSDQKMVGEAHPHGEWIDLHAAD